MKKVFILLLSLPLFFTSCKKDKSDPAPETVTDIDGNVYKTVKIGNQVWMAENLKVTKLNDGTAIPRVTNTQQWVELATSGYCALDNNQSNYEKFGALYNWVAINTGKLAPEGWHVPTDEEWAELIEYLGGEIAAPAKLKETGTDNWASPNADATNVSGFTALACGFRNYNGIFFGLNTSATWWSATEETDSKAHYCELSTESSNPVRSNTYKECGFSVRCVKD